MQLEMNTVDDGMLLLNQFIDIMFEIVRSNHISNSNSNVSEHVLLTWAKCLHNIIRQYYLPTVITENAHRIGEIIDATCSQSQVKISKWRQLVMDHVIVQSMGVYIGDSAQKLTVQDIFEKRPNYSGRIHECSAMLEKLSDYFTDNDLESYLVLNNSPHIWRSRALQMNKHVAPFLMNVMSLVVTLRKIMSMEVCLRSLGNIIYHWLYNRRCADLEHKMFDFVIDTPEMPLTRDF
ncbi:hypothetical protein RFI_34475, partial [Reticulomyxa filosa]